MTPERWRKICAIFQAVIGLAPDAREKFLDESCAGDHELRADVERLVAADARAANDRFLSGPGRTIDHAVDPGCDPAEAPPPLDRQTIGRYRLVRLLGSGGCGRVYLAYDDNLKRHVAVKVPNRDRTSTPEDVEAYLAEAQILARLDHPHIVPAFDFGTTDDGLCYVVSKYIKGTDLSVRLKKERYSPEVAAELIAVIAGAAHYAHLQDLVHRDIKPSNILIEDLSGKPYLADFGLALRYEDFGTGPRRPGTASYMSPEQARGDGHLVDGRSDVFSLGIVFYEMLTGRPPFRGASNREVMEQIVQAEARPPRQVDDTIPAELERICLKMLSKRTGERYSTAKDLADDLRHFLRPKVTDDPIDSARRMNAPRQSPLDAAPTAPTVGNHEPAPRPVKIVPKGAHSYDAHDADFFLMLLPGPRDREGLPEALRFWKARIEVTDPEKTFRVGMIYGPSGCGKSSLIKAGLVPRLAKSVVLPVYVEATAEETEYRLLRGVQNVCPELPESLDLPGALARLRQGRFLPSGRKVLLVIDQFEQWLFERRQVEDTELLAALRQCDGEHTQAIVLVRDDFWMASTRFMNALEIDLVSDRNLAVVDLFDLRHARKVLTAFGQAYGAVPETRPLPRDCEAFLDQAISELSQDGRIVPVRLALFADMIKGKPWTQATLKDGGGMKGLGKRFLKETFESPQANARYQRHQKAAQAVLHALLPESLTDIRGPMRPEVDLRKAAGYPNNTHDFDNLMKILESELRLVISADPEGSAPAEGSPTVPAGGRYYQLTHDYLVHSLREWLDENVDWHGRARKLLADRAALWSARKEHRQLPSWPEYLYLQFGVRRRDRSKLEQALMTAAGRYHGLRFALLAACLLVVAAWTWNEFQGRKARMVVVRLKEAPITKVQDIVDEMPPLRPWIDPILRFEASLTPAGKVLPLNLSLALLPTDPDQTVSLAQRLLTSDANELRVIRTALKKHEIGLPANDRRDLIESLWKVVDERSLPSDMTLCAACALAELDPDEHDRWTRASREVVACLLTKNSLAAGAWIELLTPVGRAFGPQLKERFADKRWSDDQRLVAATALAKFLDDDVKTMVDLAVSASSTQLAEIIPALQKRPEEASARLEAAFDAETAQPGAVERLLDRRAMRRAAAATALLAIDRSGRAFEAMKGGPDPRVRTYLIHQFDRVRIDPERLSKELRNRAEPSVQQALILALGQYDPMTLAAAARHGLTDHLLDLYRCDPHPGVHSAALWLLKRLGETENVERLPASRDPVAGRGWYVNGQGQTFAVLREPKPLPFVDHSTNQPRRTSVRVGRSFAISTTEVTRREFAKVLGAEGLKILEATDPSKSEDPDRPVTAVSYYHAAKFCRKLSELEGIDSKEIGYAPVGQIGPGMELPPDHLKLTGYRLPTEAEWVYACLANAETIYPFGSDAEMSHHYAWYFKNSENSAWPVGLLQPNDFGLFDILGNVYEWCEPFPVGTAIAADVAGGPRGCDLLWAPRGGSYMTRPHVESIVASYRKTEDPMPGAPPSWKGDSVTGFRIVRTCR